MIRQWEDGVQRPGLGGHRGRALHRLRLPAPQVLQDAPHDRRIVDQGDDAHRPVALGALQRIGFQSSFMQMGDNTFASLSSPRLQHGRGAGGEGPASSHVLTTLGRLCESAAPRLIWQGACIVHNEFKAKLLADMKAAHPEAVVLVHPESPAGVTELADVVGSTSALIKAAKELPNKTFIVATDNGIFHKMRKAAPGKIFLEAPTSGVGATCKSCAHCPWMEMNTLDKLAQVLETGANEIHIDEAIRQKAVISIQRMLDFAKSTQSAVMGKGNA